VIQPRPTGKLGTSLSDPQGRQLTTISPKQQYLLLSTESSSSGPHHGSKSRLDRNTTSRDRGHSPKLFLAFQRPDPRNRLVCLQQHPSHRRWSRVMLHRKLTMRPRLDLPEGQQVLRRRLHGWDLWRPCLSHFLLWVFHFFFSQV
jgi:hypothetical protein